MIEHSSSPIAPDCPIPNTHSRLGQSHRIWHQTHEAYSDPEGFRTNLNSSIEALRNTTFMLQSEKAAIPDFDPWYQGVQGSLKADPIMKWLSDARTTIVHKSDLETYSTVEGTVHNNLDQFLVNFKVPAFMSLDAIIGFAISRIPPELIKEREFLVLSIERKWVIDELPGQELLEVLAHAYGRLSNIVKEAHERVGHTFETKVESMKAVEDLRDIGGRLPCMITTKESRTFRISLKDGKPIQHEMVTEKIALDKSKIAANRYGLTSSDFPQNTVGAIEYAESLVPISKKMLAKDKYHVRIAVLRTNNGWRQYQIDARNRQDKYVLMRKLAEEVYRLGANAIIEISEAWIAPKSDFDKGIMPEKSPNKMEVLSIMALQSDGKFKSFSTIFKRSIFGKIKFEETTVDEKNIPISLSPIMKVWGLKYSENEDE